MNLKKAKFLRRLAVDVLEMADYSKLQPEGTQLLHKKNGNVINHPMSPSGIYRRVKKEAR